MDTVPVVMTDSYLEFCLIMHGHHLHACSNMTLASMSTKVSPINRVTLSHSTLYLFLSIELSICKSIGIEQRVSFK